MGRSLGKGMRECKDSISNTGDDDRNELPAGTAEPTVAASSAPREHDAV
jgi:Sec-independent protein translocase protein TatA